MLCANILLNADILFLQISYSTIPDVPGVLKLLSAEGLLLSSEHESKNTLSISEMLQLIQAPAIKIMGKSFHLQACS